jgi:DnaJ family protein B protein 12
LNCKDYYAVLGVEKSASESDLKKAYKRRAMKVHPDKNSAPKATDAFKKVNAAMACLTDADKRRVYDQVGSE